MAALNRMEFPMSIKTKIAALALAALAVTGTMASTTSQAQAKPIGWGFGVGAGLVGAAIVGSAIAAAAVAVLLGRPVAATGMPPEDAFVTIFIAGAVTAGLALLLIAGSRGRQPQVESVEATVDVRAMNHEWG